MPAAITGSGYHKTADEVRCRFENDHDEDEDLLQAHVHDLTPGFRGIDMENVRTFQQLQDDGSRHYRPDTELQE